MDLDGINGPVEESKRGIKAIDVSHFFQHSGQHWQRWGNPSRRWLHSRATTYL